MLCDLLSISQKWCKSRQNLAEGLAVLASAESTENEHVQKSQRILNLSQAHTFRNFFPGDIFNLKGTNYLWVKGFSQREFLGYPKGFQDWLMLGYFLFLKGGTPLRNNVLSQTPLHLLPYLKP